MNALEVLARPATTFVRSALQVLRGTLGGLHL